MVALVRGVHGLHGAVRVEVLTDHPETPLRARHGAAPRGRDEPLTIASAEAVADGPGWRVRFREVASRDAADTLRGRVSRGRRRPRASSSAAASTTGTRSWASPCAASDGAELGTVRDIYRVGENEVFVVDGGTVGAVRPARRSGRSSGSSRRAAARSSSTPSRSTSGRRSRRRPIPTGRRRRDGATGAGAAPPTATATGRTPPPRRTAPRRGRRGRPPTSHDPRDRRPDAVPGDVRGPAGRQHPGADPGARPRDDPGPRPARLGPRQAPLRRRHPVRRRRRHGPARRSRSRPRSTRSAGRTRWRSCSTRRARSSATPGPPTSRRATHLIFVCPRYEGVDERIRSLVDLELSIGDYVADRRRAAGARRHRCGHPPAARAPSTTRRRPRSRSAPASSSTRSTRARRRSGAWTCRPILTSGDHGAVAPLAREAGAAPHPERRPDLLADRRDRAAPLTSTD